MMEIRNLARGVMIVGSVAFALQAAPALGQMGGGAAGAGDLGAGSEGSMPSDVPGAEGTMSGSAEAEGEGAATGTLEQEEGEARGGVTAGGTFEGDEAEAGGEGAAGLATSPDEGDEEEAE